MLVMVGCSSVSKHSLQDDFQASPVKTQTKLTLALKCLGKQLSMSLDNPAAYVFLVRDIIDGTVNAVYSDGPLADSGRAQLISILSAHTKPGYGLVTDQFPVMLSPTAGETIGLNRFGLPSNDNIALYVSMSTTIANTNRRSLGMTPISTITPLIIDGAFTRYDSLHSERSITLVINIIDPRTNVVVGTEGFDLKFYSKSKTARFRVAVDEYYYGFSNTDVKVETVHAAQQILLKAGAIWILDNAFGRMVDFSPCFDSDERLNLGQDVRYEYAQQGKALPLIVPVGTVVKEGFLDEKPSLGEVDLLAEEEFLTGIQQQEDQRQADQRRAAEAGQLTGPSWLVSVGVFVNSKNASLVSNLLNRRGYASQSSPVKLVPSDRGATRIWLGPYVEKDEAKKVSLELLAVTGTRGYVYKF